MAIGRQDYQGGVVPSKSGYSLAQSNYFKYEYLNISSLASADFCEYTPAAGYRLNVCGFRVIAAKAYTHTMFLYVGGALIFYRYFDTEIMDNFPESVTLTVEAGEEFKIQVANQDSLLAWFDVAVYGYLEQLKL